MFELEKCDPFISLCNQTTQTRFTLEKSGNNPLIIIGLNPSTASPFKGDPTSRSIERIVANNGFDGWIIINLYPLRSSKPSKLPETIDLKIHDENLQVIQEILQRIKKTTIWAAWGNGINKKKYLGDCLEDIHQVTENHECTWVHFGDLTKKGNPRHPLYLNQNLQFFSLKMRAYLSRKL